MTNLSLPSQASPVVGVPRASPAAAASLAGLGLESNRRASAFARCVVGEISFAAYQRLALRRGRIARIAARRPQRARVARRAAARKTTKTTADGSDGDGGSDPPGTQTIDVYVVEGSGECTLVQLVRYASHDTPIDLADVAETARRAVLGDTSLRWLS